MYHIRTILNMLRDFINTTISNGYIEIGTLSNAKHMIDNMSNSLLIENN